MKTPEEVVTDYIANGDDLDITGEGICRALTAAGYVIVPKEPTEDMLYHGLWAASPDERSNEEAMRRAWKDMVEAAKP